MVRDAGAGLPPWAAAVARRLHVLAGRGPEQAALADVLEHLRANRPALPVFLHACLDELLHTAQARPALSALHDDLVVLCALARTAIDETCDDRAVNARAAALRERPGIEGFAASVPGRAVWLAAMAAQLPNEVGTAAAMLVNDLAAVDPLSPLRALRSAAGDQPAAPPRSARSSSDNS